MDLSQINSFEKLEEFIQTPQGLRHFQALIFCTLGQDSLYSNLIKKQKV